MAAKVFIAHGKDHAARNEVMQVISSFGLKPIVLSKVPDIGSSTIIEKFEHYAADVEFAIVLLTPDDPSAHSLPEKERYRARQNVIFEMGWLFAKFGRSRTLLLHRGRVELPSDVTGVLYKRFEKSPAELAEEIRIALRSGGVQTRVAARGGKRRSPRARRKP